MTEEPQIEQQPSALERAQEVIDESNKAIEEAVFAREKACAHEIESSREAILNKYNCYMETTMTATARGNQFRTHVIAKPSP